MTSRQAKGQAWQHFASILPSCTFFSLSSSLSLWLPLARSDCLSAPSPERALVMSLRLTAVGSPLALPEDAVVTLLRMRLTSTCAIFEAALSRWASPIFCCHLP